MARRDYLPTQDSELVIWLRAFSAQVSMRMAQLGLDTKEVGSLDDPSTAFSTALTTSRGKLDEARAATAAKRASRKAAMQVVRPLVRRLQAHPLMSDELRSTLGLALRDAPLSAARTDPMPDATPLIDLDFGTRGQMTIHFGPNPAGRNRNGLPDGALGAVVQAAPVAEQSTNATAFGT